MHAHQQGPGSLIGADEAGRHGRGLESAELLVHRLDHRDAVGVTILIVPDRTQAGGIELHEAWQQSLDRATVVAQQELFLRRKVPYYMCSLIQPPIQTSI